MCAIEAGKRGRRVAVLEHADRLGKKILISGGGRCNFTNLHCQPENFLSVESAFCQVSAGPLHARGLHRARRKASHSISREDAGATILRPLRARHPGDARGRMPVRQSRDLPEHEIQEVRRTTDFVIAHRERGIPRAGAGRRYRRPFDSENRRNLVWVRPRPPVRPQDSRTSARTRTIGASERKNTPTISTSQAYPLK